MGIRNRFRLDLNLVHKLLNYIPAEGATTSSLREQFPELGGEKVRAVREWAKDLGLIYRCGPQVFLTPLGKAMLSAKGSPNEAKIQEILYYELATSSALEVFNILINEALFEVSKRSSLTFELEAIKRQVLGMKMTSSAKRKYVEGEVSTALNALTSEEGISKLGIIVPITKKSYKVNLHRPDWRTAAYMLYDSWPNNVSRLRIDEVVSGWNQLGRIFFLNELQVMILLSKLEQERAIALEIIADLNQIGLNPAMKAQDFLEMLIHEER